VASWKQTLWFSTSSFHCTSSPSSACQRPNQRSCSQR